MENSQFAHQGHVVFLFIYYDVVGEKGYPLDVIEMGMS
jgi:hypothetical protein